MTKRRSLAICIICKNEADRIKGCLDSIAGWADQLIIFDSGSTDGTIDVLKKYDAEIYQSDWPGYGPQRARALKKVNCEWVLSIDADERLSKELKLEIDKLLTQEIIPCSVYRIPWIPFFLGKQLKYGRYSSPQARLFLKQGAQYPSVQVHETLIFPPGKIGFLRGGLIHHSFRDFKHCIDKHSEYSFLLAKEKYARKQRSSLLFATFRAWWEFIHQYFFRKLFLDGSHGYLQAIILKQYAFNKYAGLWSLNITNSKIDRDFSPHHRDRKTEEINENEKSIRRLK